MKVEVILSAPARRHLKYIEFADDDDDVIIYENTCYLERLIYLQQVMSGSFNIIARIQFNFKLLNLK